MVTTSTIVVARIGANAGGVGREGEIQREGSRFVIYLVGRAIGEAGSLAGAAHRLAESLRRDLPRGRRNSWGVEAHCLTRGDVGIVFGNLVRPGPGGGSSNPCVARVLSEYWGGPSTLERALAAAARLIAECCTT